MQTSHHAWMQRNAHCAVGLNGQVSQLTTHDCINARNMCLLWRACESLLRDHGLGTNLHAKWLGCIGNPT
eukprot:11176843-Lingulodinium_polyedra.AAC.1